MAKFRSPFNTNELVVTQTYHGESATYPNDLSLQCAVDYSKMAGSNVLSVTPGVVRAVSPTKEYISVVPDGANFQILYVHTDRFEASVGQRVSAGQLLGKIKPISKPHLHFGLKNLSGVAPHPRPMDYFDRSIQVTAGFTWGSTDNIAIRNAWFNGGSVFDWSKHKDLSYLNAPMSNFKIGDRIEFTGEQNIRAGAGDKFASLRSSVIGEQGVIKDEPRSSQNAQFNKGVNDNYTWYDIAFDNGSSGWVADVGKFRIYVKPTEPPVDPQPTECEKQITTLNNKIQALELTTETQEGQINSLLSQNKTLADNMNRLSTEKLELSDNLEKLQIMFDGLQGSYNILEEEKLDLQEELSRCKLELQEGKTNFVKKILDAIKEWLDSTVG